ncbi:MAG: DUF2304 domain-containing protein [Candidatus Moranbacteria bacterium]|nr:DUF2304 domain-containing protein [Candidatus Moranbacteria bacterium]
MKIHIYQIAITLISSLMIFKGFENYIKGKNGQTVLKLLVRIIVWGGMVLIALFPRFTNILASTIGMEGNINAIILTGFILVFLMIFKLLSAIERLEQSLSQVTRNETLKEIKKED